jgi:hypothetical protein
MKKVLWTIVIILAILISLLPFTYLIKDAQQGFFEIKDVAVLKNIFWQTGFYTHIFSGGIALMIGWLQFSKKRIINNIKWHRAIGKVYVLTALICGLTGIYVGYYSNGGLMADLGFMSIGVIYFYTTLKAYLFIKNKQIIQHQRMMVFSYACCLAAVTLRFYMPFLTYYLGDYYLAYTASAWLSWVPNLLIA